MICDTCKRGDALPVDGKTCGEALANLIEAQASRSLHAIKIERHSCLMGCDRACNIALQQDGKLTYVLGNFNPSNNDATAIIDYAEMYAASETGRVPYREWPEGIKGHFVARIPPAE